MTAMKAAFSSLGSKQDIAFNQNAIVTDYRSHLEVRSSPDSLYIVKSHVLNSRLLLHRVLKYTI